MNKSVKKSAKKATTSSKKKAVTKKKKSVTSATPKKATKKAAAPEKKSRRKNLDDKTVKGIAIGDNVSFVPHANRGLGDKKIHGSVRTIKKGFLAVDVTGYDRPFWAKGEKCTKLDGGSHPAPKKAEKKEELATA